MPSSRDVPLDLYLTSHNGQQKLGGAAHHSLDGVQGHLKPDAHIIYFMLKKYHSVLWIFAWTNPLKHGNGDGMGEYSWDIT